MNFKKIAITGAAAVTMFGAALVPAFATTETVYDALPSIDPQTSYPSQPFQAQQTAEFGDYVHLGGTNRILNNITVTMVTWARYSEYIADSNYNGNSVSWTHPITLNVYSNHLGANGVPDTLLGSVTPSITIPWRPENNPSDCSDGFKWKDGFGNCVNGLAFNANFDLSSLGVILPNDVIVSVAYNTQTWGYNPIGSTGPFNSLNVAVPPSQVVAVGSDDSNSEVFWNTSTAAWYTDGGASSVGTFRKDTNWVPYGTVALKIQATEPLVGPPNSKEECKKDGWKTFNSPTFKNQGACVSFVQANGNAGKAL